MRPFLIWRDDWLLGFEMMDEQHLQLAETLNDLHLFLVQDNNRPRAGMAQLCQRLSHMMEMARSHFQDEEALMQQHGYPGWREHHREHALLLAELQECIREIEAGRKPFTLATLKAFKYWQIDHVLNSDREFAQYIRRLTRPVCELRQAARSGVPSIQPTTQGH
jgi:hemerythrin